MFQVSCFKLVSVFHIQLHPKGEENGYDNKV